MYLIALNIIIMLFSAYSMFVLFRYKREISSLKKEIDLISNEKKVEVEFGIANGYYIKDNSSELIKTEYDLSNFRFKSYYIRDEYKYITGYAVSGHAITGDYVDIAIIEERNGIYELATVSFAESKRERRSSVYIIPISELHKITFVKGCEPLLKKTFLVDLNNG